MQVKMNRVNGLFLFLFLCLILLPLSAQNESGPVSLSSEIARLEKLSGIEGNAAGTAPVPGDRYNAFMSLSGLYRLMGNPEAALKACEGALALVPGDGPALLARGRLLFSLGDYEGAGTVVKALANSRDGEILKEARYLGAQVEAFGAGGVARPLEALGEDPAFAEYRGRIYYTLWKLTGEGTWKNRLAAEYPQNPEAGIARGSVEPAAAPLWLFFPGRKSFALSPAEVPLPPAPAPSSRASSGGVMLQTGLFSREENAGAMAGRLAEAGFTPEISRRAVNGDELWAVSVPGGKDMNAEILKLKNAGFESFPLF